MFSANRVLPIWKQAPFIRLLSPLIAGILLQWYGQFSPLFIAFSAAFLTILWIGFRFLPIAIKFQWRVLQGILLQMILITFGLFLTWQKDIRHQKNWFGNSYADSNYLVVKINEPPVEKSKSYKAEAIIETIVRNDSAIACQGKIILYFSKDSLAEKLHYGDKILINKSLQSIRNSGNPGAFNYKQYMAFQQIFHNAFLKSKDWIVLKEKEVNPFKLFIFNTQQKIISTLSSNIKGEKELGIAEALLIGYKEDLDKDLVQAYSNTGVVHIIAISGMHLGLIYIVLLWLCNHIPGIRKSKLLRVILILGSLWLFSLLTGASASVLRSAVMFTCIVVGDNFAKKASIYNSLASSAFLLLCYNPYFLWDVGFQLSYLAVISIVIFQKPVYQWIYISNKWLDKIWKLAAISLAAQILTFPICIYYFHQFPNLFLLSNLIAVPLSSIILFVEIFLLLFAWIPPITAYIGKITSWLLWLMNKIIVAINDLPFSVWDKISANIFSTFLLYSVTISVSLWLFKKSKQYFRVSLLALLGFFALHSFTSWKVASQQKLIIYNVPKCQAMDIINGNQYKFIGDSVLMVDGVLQNFHLKPARVQLQLTRAVSSFTNFFQQNNFFQINSKRFLLIDKSISFISEKMINIDYIILSNNSKINISQLLTTFNCKYFIFDASNSLWKIEQWKKECEALHLQYYSVPDNGAFVLDFD